MTTKPEYDLITWPTVAGPGGAVRQTQWHIIPRHDTQTICGCRVPSLAAGEVEHRIDEGWSPDVTCGTCTRLFEQFG